MVVGISEAPGQNEANNMGSRCVLAKADWLATSGKAML